MGGYKAWEEVAQMRKVYKHLCDLTIDQEKKIDQSVYAVVDRVEYVMYINLDREKMANLIMLLQ